MSQVSLGFDLINIVVSQADILNGDVKSVKDIIDKIINDKSMQDFENKIIVSISGYNYDTRELYEIPEVRNWMENLIEEIPFYFYFFHENIVGLIFASTNDIVILNPTDPTKRIPHFTNTEAMKEKFIMAFRALVNFCNQNGLSKIGDGVVEEQIVKYSRICCISN